MTPALAQPPNLLKWAQAYAQRGYYVFPLHNPIFDDAGNCTGCTCEEWKRQQPQYGPTYKCDQPGKCPRVKWSEKSTTDAEAIRKWWGKAWRNVDVETGRVVWNLPNIGIDAGKSGLLVLDEDSYKDAYAGDGLQLGPEGAPVTVKSITGGGGSHRWYRQPPGKAYGNATGDLPAGIDIRGAGGYIVAPPSLHRSGRRYQFADGHSLADLDPLPLPQPLIDILDAAQPATSALPVIFADVNTPAPDLSRWWLPDDVVELINHGAPKGERSEADFRVIRELAKAGASNEEIRSVFVHFAIGDKYGEDGDKYLARSISKARAWLVDHPPEAPAALDRLLAARSWVRSPDCLDRLRSAGVRRVADLVPVLDAIVEIALSRRTSRVVTTIRDLADRCAIAAATAYRRLAKLVAAELLSTAPDPYGTLIDLELLLALSGTVSKGVESVPLSASSAPNGGAEHGADFFTEHRIDEAFSSYPRAFAIKRRGLPEDAELNPGLNSSGLVLHVALEEGGTIKELAEASGLTESSVRVTLKRYEQSGLLLVWREGRANYYELHPNFEERLDEARPQMTTYGIGQLRAARNANDKANYAQRKLQGRMPLEPLQRAKLTQRRDQADEKAAAYYAALLGMGINPHAKVQHRERRPYTLKRDYGEEWVSIHRPIYEQWQQLADLNIAERYRMMGFAGYERKEVDAALRMAGKVGRGPRHFIGVNDPQAPALAA